MLQSQKSQKTVASMVIDKNSNTTSAPTKKDVAEDLPSHQEEEVDEETRLANLTRLAAKKKGAKF
jgi:hypothetical protein